MGRGHGRRASSLAATLPSPGPGMILGRSRCWWPVCTWEALLSLIPHIFLPLLQALSFLHAPAPPLCLTHLGDHLGGERRVPRTRPACSQGGGRKGAEAGNSLINISEAPSLQLLGPHGSTCAGGGRRMGREKEIKPEKADLKGQAPPQPPTGPQCSVPSSPCSWYNLCTCQVVLMPGTALGKNNNCHHGAPSPLLHAPTCLKLCPAGQPWRGHLGDPLAVVCKAEATACPALGATERHRHWKSLLTRAQPRRILEPRETPWRWQEPRRWPNSACAFGWMHFCSTLGP